MAWSILASETGWALAWPWMAAALALYATTGHRHRTAEPYRAETAPAADAAPAEELAKELLAEQSKRLELIIEGANLGTWDWNIATGEVAFNETWARMLGYEHHEIEPHVRAWETLLHPADVPAVTEALQAHLDGKTPRYATTHRLRRKNGTWGWVHDAGRVLERDAAGRPLRASGVHVDVTAQVEQQRRAEQMQRAMDASNDAVFVTDADGLITHANASFVELTGYQLDEVLGRMPNFLAAPGRQDPEVFAHLVATLKSGGSWQGRLCQRRKDEALPPSLDANGRRTNADEPVFWGEMTISPMHDDAGELQGFIAVERDVTAKVEKEAIDRMALAETAARVEAIEAVGQTGPLEDRVRNALEAMFSMPGLDTQKKAGVFLLPPGGRELQLFTWAGPFAAQLLADETAESIGRGLCGGAAESLDILITDDCSTDHGHEEHAPNAQRHGHYVVPLVVGTSTAPLCVGMMLLYTDPRPEGTPRRIDSLRSIGDAMATAIMQDRSLRMSQEARRQAEAATRAKSEFIANISHEIRTPLTAILGFADLLAECDDTNAKPETRRDYVATIQRNGHHLLSLLNDVLDLSKIEAGKLEVELIDTDPRGVLSDVAGLMKVKARQKHLDFTVEGAENLPECIQSDPVRLRQILLNLVGNAIKFTERGGVTIVVRSETGDDGPWLTIEVEDTGIGIPEEALRRLFAPFAQADASTTRRFGGTGLGLRISRALAELLGGSLQLHSAPRVGTTFVLRVPAPACERRPVPATASTGAGSTERPLEGVCVLVAEDGPDNRRLIEVMLRKAGATVAMVENGRELVDMIAAPESPSFDLVLTDMQMPELDGYEATRQLRSRGCELPIIALTANTMSGDADRCLGAGCDAYARKPIQRQQLVELCARAARGTLRRR